MTNEGSQQTLVGERYELGELLGRGGMAEVRKGVDTRLGRTVAVKRLRTDLASDATFQARFRREAQSSASLNHPTIVAVYDTGEEQIETPGGSVSQPYIVMEYVEGRTLREILQEGRRILPERALEIASGVLAALDYSHRAGIIHRDIKPGNVMLTPTGDVKVMDFGIARAISDASSSMTQTAAVVGTAQYLSPEQARGETVDSRSDVYSAGCLLYELLTGRPPFVGDSPVSVAYQHVREPAVPPSEFDEDLDPAIDQIVMKSLAKRVEDRYQSASAMRNDIERYLAGHPVQAPVVAAAPATAVIPSDGDPTGAEGTQVAAAVPPEEPEEKKRSSTGFVVLLVLLLLGLLAAAAFFLPRLMESPPDDVSVPRVVGMTEDDARSEIGDAGLSVGSVDYTPDDNAPEGEVIEQSPAPLEPLAPGGDVDLVVSSGKPMVQVPSVIGQSREEAGAALREVGLRVDMVERESDEPAGIVVATDPAPGTEVREGRRVTVHYSDGPEEVPDVVDMKRKPAEKAIRDAGFEPTVVTSSDTEKPKGTVIQQSPQGGQTQQEGSTVTIVVSSYEPEDENEDEDEGEGDESPSPTDSPSDTESPANGDGNDGNGNEDDSGALPAPWDE